LSVYRCQGCRQYHRGEPYRRFGLGAVCSPECQPSARPRQRPAPAVDDVPAATRTAVLARDGGCRYCGTRDGLHLHHIVYRSERHDHSERNLITLCHVHHQLVHSNKRHWQPILQAYITDLYDHGRKTYLKAHVPRAPTGTSR
jgi:HNH endonuclease